MKLISIKTKRNTIFLGILISISLLVISGTDSFLLINQYIPYIFLFTIFLGAAFLYLYFLLYRKVYYGPFGVTSSKENIKAVSTLINELKPKNIIDLGSGTGKMCLEIAKRNYQISGIEINPFYYILSKINIFLNGRSKTICLEQGSFWNKNLQSYDCIIIYGISFIMDDLKKKILSEVNKGTYIITVYFKFTDLAPIKSDNEVHLYQI